jgi:2-iminoacetate synthase
MATYPEWLDPSPWLSEARNADAGQARAAIAAGAPAERELARLLSPAASELLEPLARRAQALTRRHFGRTISLYAPLYLSNFCSGGCVYCGFAADRRQPRRKLGPAEMAEEMAALRARGIEEALLLTGERTGAAGFEYLRAAVALAATYFHCVTVEAFAMSEAEYRALAEAGCTGVTIYQETYDPVRYERLHRGGEKRDYGSRLEAPARALAGGMRTVGLGALLGLSDPAADLICLYRHARRLQRDYWRAGVSVSFPRLCAEPGGYEPEFRFDQRALAQAIFAFRLCLPEVPLVISTREDPNFRDGIAGVGVSKMSVASKTTVGGYAGPAADAGQFEVNDRRDAMSFCAALRQKGLEPVFKNWDRSYSMVY